MVNSIAPNYLASLAQFTKIISGHSCTIYPYSSLTPAKLKQISSKRNSKQNIRLNFFALVAIHRTQLQRANGGFVGKC